jgi:Nucleotidyltransferase domain
VITEETLNSWAQGPKATEQEKCERAERAVRKAISDDARLQALDVTVFVQGSYRNKTNVRQNSDVDICVRLNGTFFPYYPEGTDRTTFGNTASDISYRQYKALVGLALERHFDTNSVTRGDKAFKIHENTYRIDCDVIATLEHRHYGFRADSTPYFLSGIGFDTDSGKRVTNWPEQNYDNGWTKHSNTGHRYRKVVRMIKRLRDLMQTERVAAANIASCLIEAMVWNVPNNLFGHPTYRDDLRAIMAHCFNATLNDDDCSEWCEVNDIKYLFRSSQPWTRVQAHNFLDAAWNRAGFD